jgi:hypothetical protein
MTVYLSGPMTGVEDFNRPQFQEAAAGLRKQGYTVIVPGEEETYDAAEAAAWALGKQKREFYLSRDIDWIQEVADVVVVLPGWEESEGSKLEVLVAQAIGVPVFVLPDATPLRSVVTTRVVMGDGPHDDNRAGARDE